MRGIRRGEGGYGGAKTKRSKGTKDRSGETRSRGHGEGLCKTQLEGKNRLGDMEE